MSHFDTVLQDLQEKVARKRKLENVMTELRAQRSELFTQVDRLDAVRMKEQADVDKLEGGSLAAFFYNVIGKMDERLDKEREEAYAAAVKYETAARELEAVKADILRALNGGIRMRHGAFRIDEIYTRAENVLQGFTTDEVDNQFLMSPFCGFRFHGTMTVMDVCV